jgi:hypothetical protein
MGQNGVIRGFVYEKNTGEPVIFTNVYLQGTTYGIATDINGFYSIHHIPPGDYVLMVTNIEYDTIQKPITLTSGGIVTEPLYLSRSNIKLKTVDVTARRQEKIREIEIGKTVITPEQIKKIPSVGGEPDLAQYLQVIPGVIFTGDQGGQLYIRGGAPIHNKVLLDGMVIYNPFHSIGFFSVFETEIIRNVEVYSGGFSADYGGRISAIVDITTRDGNKKKFAGKISASPFMGKVLFEGPISKLDELGGGSSSFILTAKHSYLNKTSPALYSYVNNEGTLNNRTNNGIPYSFTDVYGKVALSGNNGSKVSLFGFHFQDSVTFTDVTSFNWKSLGFGSNFVVLPGQSNVLINGTFAYSNYKMRFNEANEDARTSFVGGFNLAVDLTYFVPDGEIQYGFEVNGFKTDFNFFNSLGLKVEQTQFTTELGGFVKFRKVFGEKLVFEPSFRFQFYSSLSTVSPEPRLGLKYNASEKVRIKAATGLYSQNLISTKSDRDVVNLFSGFLSGPDESLTTPDGDDAKNKLQKAFHLVGGVEYDVAKNLEIGVEGYYKRFTQLIEINRNKIFPTYPDFATETGNAYGVDFLFKYDKKQWFIWLTYSLGYIRKYDGEQTYAPHYDRRHNANIVTSYNFGKNMDWQISGRWNFGSGFPFTQTQGFYEMINFLDGVSTNYTTDNGDLGIIYSEDLNAGRLPYYHRLDFSAKKLFSFSKDMKMEVIASLTNVYNRENIFFFDRVRYERVNQLPILPSLAVNFSF